MVKHLGPGFDLEFLKDLNENFTSQKKRVDNLIKANPMGGELEDLRIDNEGVTHDVARDRFAADAQKTQEKFEAVNVELAQKATKAELQTTQINVLFPPNGLVPVDLNSEDNSTAINEMIEWLHPGGELIFPVGNIKITNPIRIIKSQIALRGFGQRTIIENNGTGNAIELGDWSNNFSRIKLEGLRVVGNVESGFGLHAQLISSKLIIRDCEFSSHGDAGAYLKSCFAAVIHSSNFSSNCRKENPSKNAGLYAEYCHNFSLVGSHMFGNLNGSDGFRLFNSGGISINGCQFEANDRYGANIQSCRGVSWNGNYIEHKGGHGLYINGTSEIPTEGVSITGGTISGTDNGNYGITLTNCKAVTIFSVCIYRHLLASVRVASTAENTVICSITSRIGQEDPATLSNAGVRTLFNEGNLFRSDVHIHSDNHLRLGSNYFWVDSEGVMRRKSSLPSNKTDGLPVPRMVGVTPSSSTSSGRPGDYIISGGYLYMCHSANSWVRTTVSDW